MSEDGKEIAIEFPFEWAVQKAFGPALTEIGEDLKKVYAKGRDKLVAAAYRKVKDPEDGKQANLRVARDVFWNGSFTEDEVCAEYFGGILASSRSEDGKADDAIQFVDVIKSLSAKQLTFHYLIYKTLNRILLDKRVRVNVSQISELQKYPICFSIVSLELNYDIKPYIDLSILQRQGLISDYIVDNQSVSEDETMPYTIIRPSVFGVLLYAAAFNRLDAWRMFSRESFGEFPGVNLTNYYGSTVDELMSR